MPYRQVNVLSDGYRSVYSQGFLYPLFSSQKRLIDSGINLNFYYSIVDQIFDCDVLLIDSKFFKGYWHDRTQDALEIIGQLSEKIDILFWFHTGDSAGALGSYVNDLMPFVDGFFKSQIYKDKTLYQRKLYGNRLFTDFYHNEFGIDDAIESPNDPLVRTEDLDKIKVSWNIGFARCFNYAGYYLTALYQRIACRALLDIATRSHSPQKYRNHALCTRMGMGFPRETIRYQREELLKIMGHQSRVSRRQYYKEMENSKIVLSPFGWGEINNRDFEAFMHGCLLVKPSVNHLLTYPEVFLENKTYLSYSWDLSDMEEVIDDAQTNYKQHIEIAIFGQEKYVQQTTSPIGKEMFADYFLHLIESS